MSGDTSAGAVARLRSVAYVCQTKLRLAEIRMVQSGKRLAQLEEKLRAFENFNQRDDALALSFSQFISSQMTAVGSDIIKARAEFESCQRDVSVWRMRVEKSTGALENAQVSANRKALEVEVVELVSGRSMRSTASRKI